jgi:hypothetical protein
MVVDCTQNASRESCLDTWYGIQTLVYVCQKIENNEKEQETSPVENDPAWHAFTAGNTYEGPALARRLPGACQKIENNEKEQETSPVENDPAWHAFTAGNT